MAANGAHNLTSASVGASGSFDEKTPASGSSSNPTLTSRARSVSLPVVGSAPIFAGGGLPRVLSTSALAITRLLPRVNHRNWFGASAPSTTFSGGFAAGLFVSGGSSGRPSAVGPDQESDSDSDSDVDSVVDSDDLREAGIVNENDSDVEDWDADNHISKKQRHQ